LDVIVPTINIRRPAALLSPHIQYQSEIFSFSQSIAVTEKCSTPLARQGWHVGRGKAYGRATKRSAADGRINIQFCPFAGIMIFYEHYSIVRNERHRLQLLTLQ
jgi:hypothetical protein